MEGEAPDARSVIDAERRVHRIMRTMFADALLDHGVSFAQLEVMVMLRESALHLQPGEIGRRLFVTRQSATHLVHQLRRADLVETWRLEGGGLGVRLTTNGRDSLTDCLRALGPTFDRIDSLEADSRARIFEALGDLEEALRPRRRIWWLYDNVF